MAHNWTPVRAVERSIRPGEWFMFDGRTKIAVIRQLEFGQDRLSLLRVVTWAERSEDRMLIGYFPAMWIAAEVTWKEWKREGLPER